MSALFFFFPFIFLLFKYLLLGWLILKLIWDLSFVILRIVIFNLEWRLMLISVCNLKFLLITWFLLILLIINKIFLLAHCNYCRALTLSHTVHFFLVFIIFGDSISLKIYTRSLIIIQIKLFLALIFWNLSFGFYFFFLFLKKLYILLIVWNFYIFLNILLIILSLVVFYLISFFILLVRRMRIILTFYLFRINLWRI